MQLQKEVCHHQNPFSLYVIFFQSNKCVSGGKGGGGVKYNSGGSGGGYNKSSPPGGGTGKGGGGSGGSKRSAQEVYGGPSGGSASQGPPLTPASHHPPPIKRQKLQSLTPTLQHYANFDTVCIIFNFLMLIRLLDTRSRLTLNDKILIYNSIIKPLWTYGLERWGSTNLQKIQSLQSKIIHKIANAPYYVSNITLHNDLKVPFVRDLVTTRYNKFHSSLSHHINALVQSLSSITLPQNPRYRLRRCWPRDHIVQWIKDIKGVFPMGNFSTNTQNNVLLHILLVTYIYICGYKKTI
jgi:hypothetical protein